MKVRAKTKRHVLVLYDLPEPISGHDNPDYLLNNDERPTERDVCRALKKLGLSWSCFGIFDDVHAISRAIQATKPDVVFNLCETFRGNRAYEGNIAGVIELSGISMTGSHCDTLNLCKDKAITKKILGYDGIRVPKFSVMTRTKSEFDVHSDIPLPGIVKPLNLEASEGIAQASVVHDKESCLERVQFIHEKLRADAIVEEFIHGREVYVGVLESSEGLVVLPPRELFMKQLREDQAMVATFQAKWNDEYRKRWGIETAKAGRMTPKTLQVLNEDSARIFKNLKLKGYARIDWRITAGGEPVFLEVNPNPALAQDDDFAKSAKTAGISYHSLIASIISSALGLTTHQSLPLAL